MKKVLLLMLALDIVIHHSFAQGTSSINKLKFNNGPTLGKNGYGCAIGDLNSDGYPDIYIANADLGSDQVWFNNGKGGFVNSEQNIGGAVKRDRSIALADLNDDGYLDVFIANDQIGNDIGCPNEVWFNDGTGKLIDSGQRLGNLASSEVALGDIDGDGDIDALIANLHDLAGNDQSNEIWLNDSKGNFTNSLKNLGSRSYTVTLADVNNDNKPDIIFGCAIWINSGNLKFTKSTQTFGSESRLYFGDFDGDGYQDAFVLKGGPAGDAPNEIWHNDGKGNFKDSGQRLGNSCGYTAAIGDIDGDGDLDIYVANGFFNKVEADVIWLNQGGMQGGTPGTFVESEGKFPATRSWEVRLGDLDNDKKLDIIVTNGWGRGEDNQVYLNITGKEFPVLKGDYLGQIPPGDSAVIFSPGIVSTVGNNEHTLSVSPDGNEIYFTRDPIRRTFIMKRQGKTWSDPVQAAFAGREAIFSPDGLRLSYNDGDICYIEKKGNDWSSPIKLGSAINSKAHEYFASVNNERKLYFSRIDADFAHIYEAKLENGQYLEAKRLPSPINLDSCNNYHPFISPKGDYIIFNSNRAGGLGGADLYICFKKDTGDWGDAMNLGNKVNSDLSDLCPVVSPDGKYFFFTKYNASNNEGDIYWVSTKVIEEIKRAVFNSKLSTNEIHDAASAGDLNKVKALLEADSTLLESKDDRDQGNLKDNTPLISACWGPGTNNWQATVANYLIDKGANVNVRNNIGATPLYFAIKDFDLTQRLIAKGADVNIRAFGDYTPLHGTAASGNLKVAKLLIDHGADPNANGSIGTVLQYIIQLSQPNEQMAKLLVENGAKLTQKSNLGNTLLHLAALKGSADWTRILVKLGADVNAINDYSHTPLYYAAKHGYRQAADVLIAAGAKETTIAEANYGKASNLNESLKQGEVYLWYLGGTESPYSGYAVKTKEHLLIFNPPEIDDSPEAGLANGHLNPNELAGQKITALIMYPSYQGPLGRPSISELAKRLPGINVVLNFKPIADTVCGSGLPPYHLATPHESFSVEGVQVHTIPAVRQLWFSSEGLGYLVEADGLKIFHAGAHAPGNEASEVEKYRKEIDYLKSFGPIDIAILPVNGRHMWWIDYQSYLYLIDQLSPKAVYLIGDDLVKDEHKKCVEVLKARNVPVFYPEGGIAVGERFHYVREQ